MYYAIMSSSTRGRISVEIAKNNNFVVGDTSIGKYFIAAYKGNDSSCFSLTSNPSQVSHRTVNLK